MAVPGNRLTVAPIGCAPALALVAMPVAKDFRSVIVRARKGAAMPGSRLAAARSL